MDAIDDLNIYTPHRSSDKVVQKVPTWHHTLHARGKPISSSDDEEVLDDDAGDYGDNGADVYDPKDAPISVDEDDLDATGMQGRDEQSHFNSDPFYKSLFHEIDSSNSDANYSSSSTTSESISVSDIDDMPTPTIYFEKDELDAIVEDEFEEDADDDAECTIRYDRVEGSGHTFSKRFRR